MSRGRARATRGPVLVWGEALPALAIRRLPALVWALPTTCFGLLLMGVALASRGRVRRVAGVLEVHGGMIGRALERIPLKSGVAAITLGHVVLGIDAAALAATREHERIHVSQCERWGPFFLPAYVGSSLWALMRGADPYRDNWFERQAYAVSGAVALESRSAIADAEPNGDQR